MPWDLQLKLKKLANNLGLIVFSLHFDKTSADFLEDTYISLGLKTFLLERKLK